MKKKNLFMIFAAVIGMFASLYLILRAIDCFTNKESVDDADSFDEDLDFDFADDYPEEAAEASVPEEKSSPTKIRRGYIPIKFHKEATDNA